AGDAWWPLAFARQLDDAHLYLRTNEPELGLFVLRSEGDPAAVLSAGATLVAHGDDWLVRETIGLLRRTLARFDVTSRSLYALVDDGSCFAGVLFELALAADRTYALALGAAGGPAVAIDATNHGLFPMVNGRTRLATRFGEHLPQLTPGRPYAALEAEELGLVTVASDELDWDEEIRLALEERASLSPDALTGMEASLRFPGAETLATKIFGRLSAWQNWVFIRPNATGEGGALKQFGSGSKPHFNWERV
ncbi:MAG: hypothetical protein WCE44_01105, partial [Candidatus Velthaea sp.]